MDKRLRLAAVGCAAIAVVGTAAAPAWGSPVTASSVQRSAAQLSSVVPHAAASAGLSSELVEWWYGAGVWHVGLAQVSSSAVPALRSALGAGTVVFAQAPIVSAEKVTPVPAGSHLIHVTIDADAAQRPAGQVSPDAPPTQTYPNRLLDGTPYSGGDRIFRTFTYNGQEYIGQCTANTLTNLGVLTAGHCGPNGTSYYQGYQDPSSGQAYYTATYGTATKSDLNTTTDAQLLADAGNGFNDTAYTNTQYLVPSSFVTDDGKGTVTKGTGICSDGSFTNEVCGGTIVQTNICINELEEDPTTTVMVCGIDEATASVSLVQAGDSGGPVFLSSSPSGYGITVGIIAAEGASADGSRNGKELFFSDINNADAALGTTQVTR